MSIRIPASTTLFGIGLLVAVCGVAAGNVLTLPLCLVAQGLLLGSLFLLTSEF